MAEPQVSQATAAVISTFHDGAELVGQMKKNHHKRPNRSQRQQEFEEKQLQDSLSNGASQITARFAKDIQELGETVKVGDAIARDRLLHIAVVMQAEVLKSLQTAVQHKNAILNLPALYEASVMNRRETMTTLDELKQRILITRSMTGELPSYCTPKSRQNTSAERIAFNFNVMKSETNSANATTTREVEDITVPSLDMGMNVWGSTTNVGGLSQGTTSDKQAMDMSQTHPPQPAVDLVALPASPTPSAAPSTAPSFASSTTRSVSSTSHAKPEKHARLARFLFGSQPTMTLPSPRPLAPAYTPKPAQSSDHDGSQTPGQTPSLNDRDSILTDIGPPSTHSSTTAPGSTHRNSVASDQSSRPSTTQHPPPSYTASTSSIQTASQPGPSHSSPKTSPPAPLSTLPPPGRRNNYHGFCKGAWTIREAPSTGLELQTRPNGMYTSQPVWSCKTCSFCGPVQWIPDPARPGRKKGVFDDTILHAVDGRVQYRWMFLAKCHVKIKGMAIGKNEGGYACVLCSVEGRAAGGYKSVEALMGHVLEGHGGVDASRDGGRAFGGIAVVGRRADSKEVWDVNIIGG